MKFLTPTVSRVLGIAVAVAVGIFFWFALSSNWENAKDLDYSLSWLAALSYVSFVAAIAASAVLWTLTFRAVTHTQSRMRSGMAASLMSWLLKYIPGQVGALLWKLKWGSNLGVKKSKTALAFAYENALLTVASTVPTIPIILFHYQTDRKLLWTALYLSALVLLFILARSYTAKLFAQLASKLTGQDLSGEHFLSGLPLLRLALLFILPRLLNAFAFVALAESMADVSSGDYLFLGASYVLAGIVGIWAILVPSGLGVREGVLVALTGSLLGVEVAISIAIVARLFTTVSDLGVAGLYAWARLGPEELEASS